MWTERAHLIADSYTDHTLTDECHDEAHHWGRKAMLRNQDRDLSKLEPEWLQTQILVKVDLTRSTFQDTGKVDGNMMY